MQVVETIGGFSVAALDGRLDSATAPAIERPLLDLIGQGGVVLDVAALSYISSAGLRVLLKAAKADKAAGNGFALCAMQPTVLIIFQISRFDLILKAYPTREEAVAARG